MRRVVTGHNAAGRSIFMIDDPAPTSVRRKPGTPQVTELWATMESPADNEGTIDALTRLEAFKIPPPRDGTIFRVVDYPPDRIRLAALAAERAAGATRDAHDAALYLGKSRHPGFHKTDTIDYAIVLSGVIWALMDEGEVLLKAGDVLVQRGTNHAWSNRTEEIARVAFVLIDAKPAGVVRNE
jgi:hypothetical protein